jgi:hypothetical protein
LLLTIIWGLKTRAVSGPHPRATESAIAEPASPESSRETADTSKSAPLKDSNPSVPPTPFAAIYSGDPKQLADSLRRVGCPEETIKDILVAEVSRKYRTQEEALRPTPADHVPWGWSAKTSEGKLIERRQQAAAIAREKEALLRAALGYDVPVKIPVYAMTTSDQSFEGILNSLSAGKRQAAQQIQENYWTQVEELRARTRGFWQSEDIVELKRLQQERNSTLAQLNKSQ